MSKNTSLKSTAPPRGAPRIALVRLAILAGVVGASFAGVLASHSQAPSLVLVFYRMLIVSLIMLVPGVMSMRAEGVQVSRADWIRSIISGVFLALHFTTFFESIKYTNLASAVLLTDMEVFFVAFVTVLIFRERITRLGWLGIVLTMAGSVLVVLGDFSAGSDLTRGNILALISAGCMSIYTLMGKLCRRRMSNILYTSTVYWVAGITAAAILLLRQIPVSGYGWREVGLGFGLALVSTLLGHSVFSWGLRYVSAPFVSMIKLPEPIFAAMWGFLFFQQRPGWNVLFGGLIILGGILLYVQQQDRLAAEQRAAAETHAESEKTVAVQTE